MSPKLLHKLESESRKLYAQHKAQLVDIILFGSAVKGKSAPQDVDILLVFLQKKDFAVAQELRQRLEKDMGMPVEVIAKTYAELFEKTFPAREALLAEGYSLIHHLPFAEGLGFTRRVMFTYQLRGKSKSERMRFYYSLHGRVTTGMLAKLKAVKSSDTVILCPVEHQEAMHEYLQSWKIEFTETPLLIPQRLVA